MFVVKIPGINSSNGETKGCERAGNAILDALKNIGSSESGKIVNSNYLDLEEIHLDNKNLKQANQLIFENCSEMFEKKPKTIFLGGDSSINFSIGKAFLENCRISGKKPCLIVFDAHADCENSTKNEFPTSKNWLRKLVEIGFSPENILLVGIRNLHPEEIIFLKQNKIRIVDINRLLEDIDETCDIIMEFSDGKELYVSIDIDVVDPAFAPSTAFPESGGITGRQLLYILQRINKIKNLRVLDITEINEKEDKSAKNITIKLGAKILAEVI